MRQNSFKKIITSVFAILIVVMGYDLLYKEFSVMKAIGLGLLILGFLIIAVSSIINILKQSAIK